MKTKIVEDNFIIEILPNSNIFRVKVSNASKIYKGMITLTKNNVF